MTVRGEESIGSNRMFLYPHFAFLASKFGLNPPCPTHFTSVTCPVTCVAEPETLSATRAVALALLSTGKWPVPWWYCGVNVPEWYRRILDPWISKGWVCFTQRNQSGSYWHLDKPRHGVQKGASALGKGYNIIYFVTVYIYMVLPYIYIYIDIHIIYIYICPASWHRAVLEAYIRRHHFCSGVVGL